MRKLFIAEFFRERSVLKTFRARKAICKTPSRSFCKAGLFMCCKGMDIKITVKFPFVPRDNFVLKIKRELCHPKCVRKVSALSRNEPQASKHIYTRKHKLYFERSSNDCRKKQCTKLITLTNHKRSNQRDEPIRISNNHM